LHKIVKVLLEKHTFSWRLIFLNFHFSVVLVFIWKQLNLFWVLVYP
jgi:hypothetical protein